MMQIIGILLVAAIAVVALKVAIIFALLIGIIFRTKQTLSLIMVLGALALFRNFPIVCTIIMGLAVIIAFMKTKDDENKTISPKD